jgi:hypothetical protein
MVSFLGLHPIWKTSSLWWSRRCRVLLRLRMSCSITCSHQQNNCQKCHAPSPVSRHRHVKLPCISPVLSQNNVETVVQQNLLRSNVETVADLAVQVTRQSKPPNANTHLPETHQGVCTRRAAVPLIVHRPLCVSPLDVCHPPSSFSLPSVSLFITHTRDSPKSKGTDSEGGKRY